MEWWQPFGRAGEVDLFDRADEVVRRRILQTGDGGPLQIATIDGGGMAVHVRLDRELCEAYDAQGTLAALHVRPGYALHGRLFDADMVLQRKADRSRGSRLRGPLMFWQISAGESSWAWHYEDRSNAEATHLSNGMEPADDPLVVTSRGNLSAEQRANELAKRRIVSRWSATARPVDVLLAQLVDLAGLGVHVRSRLIRGIGTTLDLTLWFTSKT